MRACFWLCGVSLFLLGGAESRVLATTITELDLHSEPNDPIGQGRDWVFDLSHGSFYNYIRGAYYVGVEYLDNQGSTEALVSFAAPYYGPLITGQTYPYATRFLNDWSDHGELYVAVDGEGLETLAGAFTVLEAVYGPGPTLEHFGAVFAQTETPIPAVGGSWLSGFFFFNYDPELAAVPEPPGMIGLGLLGLAAIRFCRHLFRPHESLLPDS